jgi:Glycosyl transferase family 2
MPSVQDQTYPHIEHIIVCDGPDFELGDKLFREPQGDLSRKEYDELPPRKYRIPVHLEMLPEHDPERHWGGPARNRGLDVAMGEYIAYLDDDDSFRPEHVRMLCEVLDENPGVDFVYSRMASHAYGPNPGIIGSPTLVPCNIGTPMIMHRRHVTETVRWGPPSAQEDWKIVEAWLTEGFQAVHLPEITIDVWPSVYR